MKRSTKKNVLGRIIGISAACLVISGTAVSAMGYGPLAESFRKFFGSDETTASIIDEGHFCEIGQEVSDGMFTVKLDSVTGDMSSPKLLFDVTVNDETLAASNDRLRLYAYILDEDTYRNRLGDYGMWDAVGEKDPEVNNLYHICMDGPAAFLVNQQEVITAVKQICFENDPKNEQFDYDVNMEYRFIVPTNALKESYQEFYGAQNITLSSGSVDYTLTYAEYGSYESLFQFHYQYADSPLAGGAASYDQVSELFDDDWHSFAEGFVLTVDGTEYAVKDRGYGYYDADADICSTWMSFPGVDYRSAGQITLTAGGQSYTLKDENTEVYEYDDLGGFLHNDEFTGITLSTGAVDYHLFSADYYVNETDLLFSFDFRGSPLANGEIDYHNYDAIAGAFDEDWAAFAENFILTVDGTDYTPSNMGASYCYQEGEYFEAGTCSTGIYFPGIDYANAKQITLTAGEKVITLKGEAAEGIADPAPEEADPENDAEASGSDEDAGAADAGSPSQVFYDEGTCIILSTEDMDYTVMSITSGEAESDLVFGFNFLDTPLAGGETDYDQVSDLFDADFRKLAETFVLTVDGTEYTPDRVDGSFEDHEGDMIIPGKCLVNVAFPGFDYGRAKHVALTAGRETYTLK